MVAFASCKRWPDGRQTKIVAEIKVKGEEALDTVGPSEKLRNSNLYYRSTSARCLKMMLTILFLVLMI